jgi:hypothetical protein
LGEPRLGESRLKVSRGSRVALGAVVQGREVVTRREELNWMMPKWEKGYSICKEE